MNTITKITTSCLAALAIPIALAGCAATGNGMIKTLGTETVNQAIVIGTTTKADVSTLLGKANIIHFDSGYEVWVYKDKEGAPKFIRFIPVIGLASLLIPDNTRELVILFRPDGVVKKYRVA